ncbi:hypothetical protein IE53DRAFT_141109 [Violaceomyces palustris]|uniref:Uncharacterized protein n=1 Tax=Violaceomyces palustris TaxID=1673888 RepID=A0ACD0NUK6_9BASI|nr:hypothetical protein IE53DRAFT_141109 [Violaceomyces palustris]
MSKPSTKSPETSSQKQANSPTPSGSGAVSTPAFNYAAAAAKSKASATASATASGSNTPAGSNSGASTPASGTVHGPKTNTSAPTMSSNLNPSGSGSQPAVNGTSASQHARRQSAVSLPKGANSATRAAQAINFGSVADQNAMLSSSPAAQPSSGQHLQGDRPTVFGSVAASAADSKAREKVVGFAGSKSSASEATPAPPAAANGPRAVDFQKLFQGGGSQAQNAGPPASAAAPIPSSSQNPVVASNPAATGSPSPSPAVAHPSQAPQPSTPGQQPRHTASNLRPPAGAGHHPGARPFEPQRSSPSQPHHLGGQNARPPSNAPPTTPFQPHPGHQGGAGPQPRSPHMANATPMQPMQAMGGPMQQWPQHQPINYPPQYAYHPGYAYQPVPQHWAQQQPGYEMPGTPRSPRHANMASSPMVPNAQNGIAPGTPSMTPSSSMSSARGQTVPPSPSTAPSSIASPGHHAAPLGMGQPPAGRPQAFQAPGGGFIHHSPSHSFGNPMSPSARQFEPAAKRQSSAIRIVNPDTQAAVDLQTIRAPSTPTTSSATVTRSPSVAKGTPLAQPAERKPVRMETPEAFLKRVQEKKKEEDAKKKAEAEAAAKKASQEDQEAAAAAAAEAEAKKKAEEEEAERQRKAKEEEEKAAAAAKREAEEKAEAERKAKEEEERRVREEAERKEREEREARERQAKEAEERAAREKAEKEAEAKRILEEEEEAKRRAQAEAEAEAEAKAKAEAEAAAAAAKAEAEAKAAEEAKSLATTTEAPKAEEGGASEERSDKHAAVAAAADAAAKDSAFRGSVADVERMAREASSVPSTPLDALPPRTPGIPQTPRTPGTPGFAGLPAKPTMTSATVPSNGIKLDNEALEKRKKQAPGNLDLSTIPRGASSDSPLSAASAALGSARFIDNINKVSYPKDIASPKAELNEQAEPGKFRYDREFLMQFMGVFTEKPHDLPPLASIGMEGGQAAASRGAGRRAPGMGPPAAPGRGGAPQGLGISASTSFGGKGGVGMGQFSHPAKTSEERFAASSSGLRPAGAMGAFGSGPMGSFNAGARSQPLSRTGSGSSALPSRDVMGTGIPAGGRTKSNRGRQRDPNSSRGPPVNPPEKGGPTIPLDQVVPLASSENRWTPMGRSSAIKADSPEMVQRKVKALLNKLTLEKFDSISDQILEWANKSVNETDGRTLRQVIALIFEKATDEAAFSEMYARLCRKLNEEVSHDVKDESLKGSDGKAVVGGHLFRKYLLNRCQEDFERGWAQRDASVAAAKSKEAEDKAKKASNEKAEAEAKEAEERGEKPATDVKEAELLSDEYYEAQKAKRRGLGLVRFIGELFKLSMLTERIMHLCIKKLLSNATDPEEEEIESLCKLMTTVGKLLDTEKARGHIDVYFQRMREMSQNEATINSRMRFMLLDVIELRESGWVPRRDNSAPKTIAQIHAEAAKAKQQQEQEMAARQAGGRGGPMSRGGSRRGQARGDHLGGPPGPDGWSTVGGQSQPPPRPSKAGDLSSFGKIDRSGAQRPLSFGPQNIFSKKQQGKGSDDGSNPPTRTNSTTNMFSLLNASSGDGNETNASAPAEEPQRPRLQLQKRTKPLPGAEDAADKAEEETGGGEDADKAKAANKGGPADLSDEAAKTRISNDVKEFLSVKDVGEGAASIAALPLNRRAEFVKQIVDIALNKKEEDVKNVAALFARLRSDGLVDDEAFVSGFKDHVEFVDDLTLDVPQAYPFLAKLLVGSGLPHDKIEAMTETMSGEGIKTPKQKLLEKIEAERNV